MHGASLLGPIGEHEEGLQGVPDRWSAIARADDVMRSGHRERVTRRIESFVQNEGYAEAWGHTMPWMSVQNFE